jgi:hypothetical protein
MNACSNFLGVVNKPGGREITEIPLNRLERIRNFFHGHVEEAHRMASPREHDRPSAPDETRSDNCHRFAHI